MARVDVPASGLAWALLDAELRGLTGAVQVVVVRLMPAAEPQADAAAQAAAVRVRASQWLARPDLISVAVVTTPLTGAALALALSCDLRVLAHDVTLRAGGAEFLGGVGPLVGLVGRSRALELCLTGRRINAAEAAAVGLATVAVAHDQVDNTVADLVAALLSTSHSVATEIKALVSSATDTVALTRQLADEYAASERVARDEA